MKETGFKYIKEISSPVKAVCCSNFEIENSRLAVILNSRQSKTPFGDDPWIVNSIKAVKHAAQKKHILITSTEMNTWELVCWACGNINGYQIVVCPIMPEDKTDRAIKDITNDFGLDKNKTGWLFFEVSKAKSKKANWPVRDRLAVDVADIIIPVSIRPDGNLQKLVNKYTEKKKKVVVEDFQTEYASKKRYPGKMPEDIGENLKNMTGDYITHWTRTCYGRLPGETRGMFYLKLVSSNGYYPNRALEILKNILIEKRIRGSSTHQRNAKSVVAFSSLHPKDILSLMSWRKRYVRWNFEPYGIAVAREAAVKAGIQPVFYGKSALYKRLSDKDKPYFQSEGENGSNWREESEWRYLGDLNLAEIDPSDIKIIVGKPDETKDLKGTTESEIISFT